jgi:hypothetical protein
MELRVINPDLHKKDVAKFISCLTGYAEKQMINGLSFNIKEKSKEAPDLVKNIRSILESLESMLPDTQA